MIADGVRHSLKCYTGQVIHSSSGIERITNVHGNQNYVESSSYSVEHDKFHVVDTTGKEHAVHLWNSGVQVRPGSIVSAAWFEGPHAEKSGYAIFVNHDTDRYTALWSNLEKFFPFALFPYGHQWVLASGILSWSRFLYGALTLVRVFHLSGFSSICSCKP
ncbi:MAG: hypothetical protein IPJ85_11035 [Flavobacteriales bacterium]|nr:hypothetical protein [Flavobacteriales bacterium]